jgi:3-phenylpropionate/trans-cinnamate dioxygenase ferredoxin component
MTKATLGKVGDFPHGTLKEVQVGGKNFAVANIQGKLYSLDGVCSHAGGRIGQGQLVGETVKSPKHGAEYDLKTGKNLKKPWIPFAKAADLKTYDVTVDGDNVVIDV